MVSTELTALARERALPPEVEKVLMEKYNLDAPLLVQYKDYMVDLLHGDLGPSFQKVGVRVSDMIAAGFPISAKVGGIASLMIIAVGIPLGIWAALKKNTRFWILRRIRT